MIQLQVLPRVAVEGKTFDDDTLVISISSPRQEPPKINAKYVHVYHFEDVTEEYKLPANDYRDELIVAPMGYEIAEAIVEVVWNNMDKKKWVIHCEAGISRSPGVAIALSRFFNTCPNESKLRELFPGFNTHVHSCIVNIMWTKVQTMRG